MRLAVKKLQIEDAAKLQTLVVENLDAIEPGLAALDARLLLGHSTIDVVGVDAAGTLVLIAVGFTANEEMILKAVEAYSWSLEYPQALQRLYPGCVLSEERPPRLLFVAERMPDAFHRKIKQLGFPEVDCVEVRHLDVDGIATVYFESLVRIRRLTMAALERAASSAAPAPEPPRGPVVENVIAMNGNGQVRVTAPKLPKPTSQPEAPVSGPRPNERPTGSVVSMINRQPTAPAPSLELPRLAIEPVILRPQPVPVVPEAVIPAPAPVVAESVATEPIAVAEPVVPELVVAERVAVTEPIVTEPVVLLAKPIVAEPEPAPVTPVLFEPEPVMVEEPKVAPTPTPAAVPTIKPVTPRAITMPVTPTTDPAAVPPLAKPVATSVPSMGPLTERVTPRSLSDLAPRPAADPAPVAKAAVEPAGERVSFKDLAQALLGATSVAAEPPAPAVPGAVIKTASANPEPKPVAAAPMTPAPVAEPPVEAAAPPALTVESLAAMSAPASATEQTMVADTAKQLLSALPQEFEGLTFPNDGVLTRQWMEFLNQMSGPK